MRLLLFPVLFTLAACSAWTGGTAMPSRFETAAKSWTGAPLDEMIAVYGPPRTFLDDAEVEGAGIAIWRSRRSEAYRCNVSAWYDPERTVTRVDVSAHNCDDQYEEYLDILMRRP